MVEQGNKKLGLRFKARVDTSLLERQYRMSLEREDFPFKVSKAFEANYLQPETAADRKIKELIDASLERRVREEQQELFAYKKRLGDAERKLVDKVTKTAQKEKEVCERQIDRIKGRLDRIQAKVLTEADSRIYSKNFAPLIVSGSDGERMIQLQRYLLRPDGQPETFDAKYPGCYNARLDNLEGFPWKYVFGRRHGILIAQKFFENVERHAYEKRSLNKGERSENMVLCFEPRGMEYIIMPCLYDIWRNEKGEEVLHSFALITDEPNPEVAAAGHDRTPIFLRESAIDDWLSPAGKSKEDLYAILREQRERPFYEHRVAA